MESYKIAQDFKQQFKYIYDSIARISLKNHLKGYQMTISAIMLIAFVVLVAILGLFHFVCFR